MADTAQPQIYQPNGPLDQLAYNFANQPAQPQQYRNQEVPITMGLDVTPPDKGVVMGNYLHNLGTQHIQMQQQQKDQQFLKSVHDVMSSNSTNEDKINHLVDLNTQHGGGYLDDTIKQLGGLTKQDNQGYKPQTLQDVLTIEKAKSGYKPSSLDEAINLEQAKKSPPKTLSQPEIDKINSEITKNESASQFYLAQAKTKGQQNPESQKDLAQADLYKAQADKLRNTLSTVPDTTGMDKVGYYQNGQPIYRKPVSKPPSQGQETTALYASRIKQANDILGKLEGFTNNLNMGDMVQAGLPDFANFMKSEDMQSYQQAQKNFLTAVLRRESGAVISPSEFKEGRSQYFPQPGDKPAVLAQKKANRDLVMQNFVKAAGSAYIPYQGAQPGQAQPQAQPQAQRLTATNPQNGQKIQSLDGGQTWQPAQ